MYCFTDNDNNFLWGIKHDGSIDWSIGIPTPIRDAITEIDVQNTEKINILNELISVISDDISLFKDSIKIISNKEYIYAIVDNDNNILLSIDYNGNIKFIQTEYFQYHYLIKSKENIQITLDDKNNILSQRQVDGTLIEPNGIITEQLTTNKLILSDEAKQNIIDLIPQQSNNNYNEQNLPKYGTVNLKSETFYLSYDSRVNTLDDVVIIQDFEDNSANAANRMTLMHYYIKSTLTDNGDNSYSINDNSVRLRHFASSKVKYNEETGIYEAKETIRNVNGVCYYADTLGLVSGVRRLVIEGYSIEAPNDSSLTNGKAKQVKTRVTEPLTGPVYIKSWTVEDWDTNAIDGTDIGKKYEHNCIVDIDFGYYYKKNDIYVGVKHQGNSTPNYRKRNLRFTFYKDNTYDKKDKIKIGEMIRQSGYNLKASYTDTTRIKEYLLYRIFNQIWDNRPINDRYQWDNKVNGYFHSATGTIKCFPITVNTNGKFYGIYLFGLKKDEKNYMLDGSEESGVFVAGAHNTSTDWIVDEVTDDYIKYHYDLEMQDEWFESDLTCLKNFHNFIINRLYEDNTGKYYAKELITEINDKTYVTDTLSSGAVTDESIEVKLVEFNKENIPDWLDLLGFIDYFICMQAFVMIDNGHNNMAVYFGPDKKKFHPFFYDLDNSIYYTGKYTYDCDILAEGISLTPDMSIYQNLFDLYKDEITNRYIHLRKTYLTIENIRHIFEYVRDSIPEEAKYSEMVAWSFNINSFEERISFLEKRFKWLDEEYFKI